MIRVYAPLVWYISKKKKTKERKIQQPSQISRYQPAINKTIKSTDIAKPFDMEPFTRRRERHQQGVKQKIVRSSGSARRINYEERPGPPLRDLIMPAGVILAGFPERGRKTRRERDRARAYARRTRTCAVRSHPHTSPPSPLFARGSQGRAMCIV